MKIQIKNKKIFTIFMSVFLLIAFIGISYAFYTAVIDNGDEGSSIISRAGNLEVTYTDGSKQIIGATIYPGWSDSKTFTVKNTGNAAASYSIMVTNITNNFSIKGSVSLSFDGKNGGKSLAKTVLPLNDSTLISYVPIAKGVTHTYTVTTYYNNLDVDQSQDKGKSFAYTIEIDKAYGNENEPNNWTSTNEGTLLAGIKQNYSKPSKMLTNPLNEGSSSSEAVMSSAEDDYGTSYFFRGNVQNNFVSFAGMCWRIVRITGDGSIKLVLYDYSSANCTNTGNDLAFARYDGTDYRTQFNTKNDDNAYVGFMYGAPNSSTYAETHANTNKSIVLQNLETWYKEKLISNEDKLADVIWCNDKSTTDSGYGNSDVEYGTFKRIGINATGYSLICPNDKNGGKLSKFTANDTMYGNGNLNYKIGLLTAEENTLAGYGIYSNNASSTSYLTKNANYLYWTLSPNYLHTGNASIWSADKTGYMVGFSLISSLALRPSIALRSTVKLGGGDGTASNPYVVIDEIQSDTLIAQDTAKAATSKAFNGPITKEQVEKIVIKNTNTVPSNAIASWDAGAKHNGAIMAYTLDEDNDGLYELYIGQEDGVIVGSNASYLFGKYNKLESIDLSNLKTSKVTNMRYMFSNSAATEIKGLNQFNTSKVTNMSWMFSSSAATSLDLSNFDTRNVTNMRGMFSSIVATTLNLSNFDTSKVTNMSWMFNSSAATTLDLSSFDTSKVTDMSSMFYYSEATSINLSSFDTSNVTNMSGMFWISSATSLDLSSFDTSKVTDMSRMFNKSAATEIKGLTNFNTSKVTNMLLMFEASKATILDLSSFDTSNVTNMSSMFSSSATTEIKGLNQFNTSNVTDMSGMFYSSAATSLDLSNFDTSNVTSMSIMFFKSAATEIKGLNQFNTSKVTDMSRMFGESAATNLDLNSFDTSKVTKMSYMFWRSKATSIDLSSFDTSNVTDMTAMFKESKIITLDLSSFNTSNVTNMYEMFYQSAATSLDLSSFDTSNVTNMYMMFRESKATTLDLSNFNTSKVTDMSYMFIGCKATTGYARTQADADKFNASSGKPSGLTFVVKS